MKKKILFILLAILLVLIIGVTIFIIVQKKNKINIKIGKDGKIDDWQYSAKEYNDNEFFGTSKSVSGPSSYGSLTLDAAGISNPTSTVVSSDSTLGLSVGGAKDIENFRKNIEDGYFPVSTDITYNGLFYDYSFDTGKKTDSNELFSPSYSTAISKDPISNKNEYYMTVGLNSNIKESDFQRKKLNLVVVLDISGSMDSNLDSYYYDNNKTNDSEESKTKMELADESVNILLDQLNDDDRFGMVLFDDSAYLGKPLSLVGETDMDKIKNHILEIDAQGGTNFEAGYTKATELFNDKKINADEYENRIIVITDAMPNYGETSKDGLMSYVEKNAKNGIYTTLIGVGIDFNSELTEAISNVKGANYYSVNTASEFKERMGEQFEYMVTPLVFDLNLSFDSDGYEIETVYGSDTVNKENGNIMKVNTLFPSKTTSDGEVKGGIVLLKLKKKENSNSNDIKLKVSYKDRNDKSYNNEQNVTFDNTGEYYDNTGIRKAIILTRYANVLKDWILYERSDDKKFIITSETGISDCGYSPDEVYRILGENERTSVALTVSSEYKKIFEEIKQYIQNENKSIQDNNLEQEIKLLNTLIEYK